MLVALIAVVAVICVGFVGEPVSEGSARADKASGTGSGNGAARPRMAGHVPAPFVNKPLVQGS
jgi:hypothetical protein